MKLPWEVEETLFEAFHIFVITLGVGLAVATVIALGALLLKAVM